MKFIDAYILARTKRKTRRIRTALVVVVSSLLFAVLFGLSLMAQGLVDSGKQVRNVGFNSRYLTSINSTEYRHFDHEAEQKKIEAKMLAELRARGVKVDEQTKQNPDFQAELNRRMNNLTGKSQKAQTEKLEKQVDEMGNPSVVYHFTSFPFNQLASYQPDPKKDPMVEAFQDQEKSGQTKGPQEPGISIVGSLEFYHVEAGMLRTQIREGQTTDWQPGQPYPLVIPYGYLEELSGRSFSKLSAEERNKGYGELISKYTGYELNYCYRNSTAQDQLRAALNYNKSAENDKNPQTKPIALPLCANFNQAALKKLGIVSENNSTGAKPLFPQPKTPKPEAKRIKFKIVGFIPSQPAYGSTDVVSSILTSLSVLPTGQLPVIIPSEAVKADPLLKKAADSGNLSFTTLFADFKTRADQKAFLEKGCTGSDCIAGGKPYVSAFGNISVALEGIFRFFSKFFLYASMVIMVIAGLMIMFTISKVIADSTKEIAVFRSLGARRRDIAQIYYTYGFMLAGSALVVALLIAIIGALLISNAYDDKIAQGLINATGAYGQDIQADLIGINRTWTLGIAGALFAAAALGIAVPVLASVRRKLITILREE